MFGVFKFEMLDVPDSLPASLTTLTNCALRAAVPGPAQAAAFAWLGRFYREVASDAARARKCFQKALALDPTQADAGACKALLHRHYPMGYDRTGNNRSIESTGHYFQAESGNLFCAGTSMEHTHSLLCGGPPLH